MSFGHKKLDVYKLSLEYIQWVYRKVEALTGTQRHARDQLLRASQSIPLNIAEGNGKITPLDRGRFFGIARGSALECAAIQDVLLIAEAISQDEYDEGEALLVRIVAMLTKLGRRGYTVREQPAEYCAVRIDSDADSDSDPEKEKDRTRASSGRLESGAAHATRWLAPCVGLDWLPGSRIVGRIGRGERYGGREKAPSLA